MPLFIICTVQRNSNNPNCMEDGVSDQGHTALPVVDRVKSLTRGQNSGCVAEPKFEPTIFWTIAQNSKY